jgi:hypothetical protein
MAYRDRVVYLHQHGPAVCDGPILTQPVGCDPGGSSEITDEEDMAAVIGSDRRLRFSRTQDVESAFEQCRGSGDLNTKALSC